VDVYGYDYIPDDNKQLLYYHGGLSYRRGLLRCSFNYDGQCEGLYKRDE